MRSCTKFQVAERRVDLPERNVKAPKPSTPTYFGTFLATSWAQGSTKLRHLFSDIRHRGYTGSFNHLASFVALWRRKSTEDEAHDPPSNENDPAAPYVKDLGSSNGSADFTRDRRGPVCQAARPNDRTTARQSCRVKGGVARFFTMRSLAMRLQSLLRGGTAEKLDTWLQDARASRIHGMRRFARTALQDFDSVSNAALDLWSNGQTEGQINRLKTLKRAMYGRAGVDLLRARPLLGP